MTGRGTTLSMDGTPISQADIDRMEEEERLHAERQRQAARVVASAARDADDCRTLLDMLGLDHDVVLAARKECAARTEHSASPQPRSLIAAAGRPCGRPSAPTLRPVPDPAARPGRHCATDARDDALHAAARRCCRTPVGGLPRRVPRRSVARRPRPPAATRSRVRGRRPARRRPRCAGSATRAAIVAIDRSVAGRNPARVIPALQHFVDSNPRQGACGASASPCAPATSDAVRSEIALHELMLQLPAFRTWNAALTCAVRQHCSTRGSSSDIEACHRARCRS